MSFTQLKSDEKTFKLKYEILKNIRCLVCQGQSVHDSESDYSKDIKIFVKEKFEEGLSKQEIKKILTERYGEYILFKPYFNSKNLFLWLFPFVLVLLSITILLINSKKTKTK